MPTYFDPKWGSMTKTGPEEAHKSETTSLYHGAIGTCSQQIQIQHWFVYLHQELGPKQTCFTPALEALRPETGTHHKLPPVMMMPYAKGCTSTRAALSQRRSPFRNLSRLRSPEKTLQCMPLRWPYVMKCHVTKRLHCQTVCCSPQTSWHNSWDKLPTMFLHMHKWLLHCPFCNDEMSLPLPFSSTLGAQVWLRHHFEPENLQANFASKGLGG